MIRGSMEPTTSSQVRRQWTTKVAHVNTDRLPPQLLLVATWWCLGQYSSAIIANYPATNPGQLCSQRPYHSHATQCTTDKYKWPECNYICCHYYYYYLQQFAETQPGLNGWWLRVSRLLAINWKCNFQQRSQTDLLSDRSFAAITDFIRSST